MLEYIRKATLHDCDELLELERLCFSHDLLTRTRLRHYILAHNAHVYVQKSSSAMVASAIVLFRQHSNIARLYSFAVHPNWRRQGIGEQFLIFIETDIRKKAREIRLEVRQDNETAIQFYQKLGYETFGSYEAYYDDNIHASRLKKRL